jgi:hypothetical protein
MCITFSIKMSCARNLCIRKIVERRKLEKKKMKKNPRGACARTGGAVAPSDRAPIWCCAKDIIFVLHTCGALRETEHLPCTDKRTVKAGKMHSKLIVVHFRRGAGQRALDNILHAK